MISTDTGTATTYSLLNMAERGVMFVEHGDPVYTGQIVGEHNRDNDLMVNIVRAKQMTNIRARQQGCDGGAQDAAPVHAGSRAGIHRAG